MKEALMEYETQDSDQVDDLMNRRPVRPPHDWHNDLSRPGGGAAAGGGDENTGRVGDPAGEH
jgi:cell division protease FtsH